MPDGSIQRNGEVGEGSPLLKSRLNGFPPQPNLDFKYTSIKCLQLRSTRLPTSALGISTTITTSPSNSHSKLTNHYRSILPWWLRRYLAFKSGIIGRIVLINVVVGLSSEFSYLQSLQIMSKSSKLFHMPKWDFWIIVSYLTRFV